MNYPFIKVIDNFYDNPDTIRNHALDQKYEKISRGFFMGNDTIDKNIINDECREKLQKVFEGKTMKVTCARYRNTRFRDQSMKYIHRHDGNGYHVIIYLTPDEINTIDDGINFYEHKKMGKRPNKNFSDELLNKESFNLDNFQCYHKIDYKYNRAVIVDYNFFHSAAGSYGYGNSLENCRLIQIIEVVL